MLLPQCSIDQQMDVLDAGFNAWKQAKGLRSARVRAQNIFKRDLRVQKIAQGDPDKTWFLLQIAHKVWQKLGGFEDAKDAA